MSNAMWGLDAFDIKPAAPPPAPLQLDDPDEFTPDLTDELTSLNW